MQEEGIQNVVSCKRMLAWMCQTSTNVLIRYLYGQSSRSELKITRQMLSIILTYHQVMPAYLDFVFAFGAQSDPRDLRFSGFQEQTMLKTPQPGIEIPELGRSGRQFQLCYNLKGVKQRFKELTGTDGRPEDKSFSTVESCFRASLSAHLLYSHWSTEGWRWYIAWLEKVIESEVIGIEHLVLTYI